MTRPTAPASHTPPNAPAGGDNDGARGHTTDAVKELAPVLATVRELTALLITENEALRRHRFAEIKATLERKTDLAQTYAKQLTTVGLQAAHDWPQQQKDEIHSASKALEAAAHANTTLLQANIDAANCLISAFADAARDNRLERASRYDDGGRMDASGTDPAISTVALNGEY